MIANGLMAVVGDVFGPAVAALTLGLYLRKQLARRMGRNSAFDHGGNVAIAYGLAKDQARKEIDDWFTSQGF